MGGEAEVGGAGKETESPDTRGGAARAGAGDVGGWNSGAFPPPNVDGDVAIDGGWLGKAGGLLNSALDAVFDNGPVTPGITTVGDVVVAVRPGGNGASG